MLPSETTDSFSAFPADMPAGVPDPSRPRRARKWKLLALAVAVMLIGAGIGTYFAVSSGASTTAAPVTTANENVAVTTATMKQTVSASGTLDPTEDSDLTFAVGGTVTAVDVTTGQKVTAGQTLATVDPTALGDEEAAAQATVTSDRDKLTTDEDDAAASTIDSDGAQVTSAESQLATAETNVADATLKATFTGTVAAVDLTKGTVVSGSGGSTGGTANTGSVAASASDANSTSSATSSSSSGITIISTGSYSLSTSVDDTEVGEVNVGDQAVITPSGSTTTIYGTVASVSLIASSSSSSSSSASVAEFPVVIDVTGSPTGIYPGDSATASIVTKEIQNAVEVPTAALSYSNGQATVTQVVAGSHKTVDVTTGIAADNETQITRGLKAGDMIVEQVVKFNASGGSGKSLFGGTSTSRRGGTTGEFPAGGAGPGGGAGFGGGGQ